MDTNVKAIFFLTRELLPLLRKGAADEDPARVINISSIEAFKVPAWENYAYSASKAAVIQLTRHLARRLADDRITGNERIFSGKLQQPHVVVHRILGETVLCRGVHRFGSVQTEPN